MLNESRKENKIQPVGKRTEPHSKIGSKPATIRSNDESEFVIEIYEKENKNLPTVKSLCSPQFQETVEVEIFSCEKKSIKARA